MQALTALPPAEISLDLRRRGGSGSAVLYVTAAAAAALLPSFGASFLSAKMGSQNSIPSKLIVGLAAAAAEGKSKGVSYICAAAASSEACQRRWRQRWKGTLVKAKRLSLARLKRGQVHTYAKMTMPDT